MKNNSSNPRCSACAWLAAAGGLVLLACIGSWRPGLPPKAKRPQIPPVDDILAAEQATLLCWSVVYPSESTLLRAQWELRAGIFGCDDWRVFTNRSNANVFGYLPADRVLRVLDSTLDAPRDGAFHPSTPELLQPWRMLPSVHSAHQRAIDWVVKVNVDTCFRAQRLQDLITKLAPAKLRRSPKVQPYVLTSGLKHDFRPGQWLQGPLEVLSVAGQRMLAQQLDNCSTARHLRKSPTSASACIFDHDGFHFDDTRGPQGPHDSAQPREAFAEYSPKISSFEVIKDPRLLCWRRYDGVDTGSGAYVRDEICTRTTDQHLVAFHPTKTEKVLQACYRDDEWVSVSSKETLATCSGTQACLAALRKRPHDDRKCTCASHIEALLRSSQLTEEQACSRIAGEFPLSCGPCAMHGGADEARAAGEQVFLFRTTAASMVKPGKRAAAIASHLQIGDALHVLVDKTICGGLTCDDEWLAQSLGMDMMRVWGFTACDVLRRWPDVQWPLLGVDENAARGFPRHHYKGEQLRCWLLKKAEDMMREVSELQWPYSTEEGTGGGWLRNALTQCDAADGRPVAVLMLMVSYLVHEPVRRLAHQQILARAVATLMHCVAPQCRGSRSFCGCGELSASS